MSDQEPRRKRMKKFITLSSAAVFVTVILVFLINLASAVSDAKGQQSAATRVDNAATNQAAQIEPAKGGAAPQSSVTGWGFLAAALSTGFGCLGAGIAVAYVGSAALGVIGEKPELTGRALIYVGLAEGIAIYGLIIAIMILTRI
jgi:V/A-type H+/Na+-transporting ATPase subunit K